MCREAHYLERIGTGGLKDQWKWEEHLCPSKAESLVEKEKHSVDYSFKALPWKWWTAMYVISCDGGQQILPFVMYIGESTGNPLQYSCLENPWTEEPGRLQSVGSLKVRHDWAISLSLFTFMHWRRNGNPLQCSCLENPRDGEAWWAAVYGVAQSQTRLTQLSSSSSACTCHFFHQEVDCISLPLESGLA